MHIGVKVGAGLGGVAVLGLLVWLGISLLGGGAEQQHCRQRQQESQPRHRGGLVEVDGPSQR